MRFSIKIDGVAFMSLSQYGISRSATVVVAYLMKSEKLSFSQALEQLREKKPDVRYDDDEH